MEDALCISMQVPEIYGRADYDYVPVVEYCS